MLSMSYYCANVQTFNKFPIEKQSLWKTAVVAKWIKRWIKTVIKETKSENVLMCYYFKRHHQTSPVWHTTRVQVASVTLLAPAFLLPRWRLQTQTYPSRMRWPSTWPAIIISPSSIIWTVQVTSITITAFVTTSKCKSKRCLKNKCYKQSREDQVKGHYGRMTCTNTNTVSTVPNTQNIKTLHIFGINWFFLFCVFYIFYNYT